MGYKTIIFVCAIVAAANAGIIGSPYSAPAYGVPVAKVAAAPVYSAPVAKIAAPAYAKVAVPEPYDPHPQYNYAYEINDQHTGDVKSQQEWRDGDVVKGYYSLIEPDGTKRTVEYEADPHNGFNAVVHREHGAGPVVAKVAAPVAYAAPVAKVAAPVAYAAPIAKVAAPLAYAAPVAKVAAPYYGGYH
ncbi:Insect cuticle protein [Popillia japonica]|uniref:Insect cuticle protein n=1 Tax=Popillia japonica TaxID=7064 RepID=A0AAW1MHT3_POPJA